MRIFDEIQITVSARAAALVLLVLWHSLLAGVAAAVPPNQTQDLFGNGKAILSIVRDGAGALERLRIDIDGNGIDRIEVAFREKPLTTRFYRQGQIVRRVTSSGAGQADDFQMPPSGPFTKDSYSWTPDSEFITVTTWSDPSRRDRYVGPGSVTHLPRQSATELIPDVISNVDAGCPADQAAQIRAAVDQMLAKAVPCLVAGDLALAAQWKALFQTIGVKISCRPSSADKACAASPKAGDTDAWAQAYVDGGAPIVLYPEAFDDPKRCPFSLAETIFHESLHYVTGPHPHPEMDFGRGDPSDRVYGCQATCFGTRSLQTCAACFGGAPVAGACRDPSNGLSPLVCPAPDAKPGCSVRYESPIASGSFATCRPRWDDWATHRFANFEMEMDRAKDGSTVVLKAGAAAYPVSASAPSPHSVEITAPTLFGFSDDFQFASIWAFVPGPGLKGTLCQANSFSQLGSGEVLFCPLGDDHDEHGLSAPRLAVIGRWRLECQSRADSSNAPATYGSGTLILNYIPGKGCCPYQ